MFIKITKSKNYNYLQLVESYREANKTKHRVIANLGRFDQLEDNPQILALANRLLTIAGKPTIAKPKIDMEELGRRCYGHVAYQKLWDQLKLSSLLGEVIRHRKINFNWQQAVWYLVVERLLNPSSKLASFQQQEDYLQIGEQLDLHHLYRALDLLADHKEDIEQGLFEQHRNLFNCEVDVVFYDVTTFHFESINQDVLKDFGFSKNAKFNEVQVVMGLMLDSSGRPVGYELFSGNTFEGSTLTTALNSLKKRFAIKRLIIVADKGLNSGLNLAQIKEEGYDYIVSCPLKRQSKKIKQAIFDQKGYKNQQDSPMGEEVDFKYKFIEDHPYYYTDEQGKKQCLKDRLLITWSSKRAKHDAFKRNRLIDKAHKIFAEKKDIKSRKGAAKYLQVNGKTKVTGIDEEKIENDARWDGYYGIQSSDTNLDHQTILEQYHLLWKIERAFRILKSTMKTRPIFHWTPKRIRGHFMLCFIAFVLERNMEIKLQKNNIKDSSPEKIKKALNSLQVSEVRINGKDYYLKGKNEPLASKILRILKIKPLKNMTPMVT